MPSRPPLHFTPPHPTHPSTPTPFHFLLFTLANTACLRTKTHVIIVHLSNLSLPSSISKGWPTSSNIIILHYQLTLVNINPPLPNPEPCHPSSNINPSPLTYLTLRPLNLDLCHHHLILTHCPPTMTYATNHLLNPSNPTSPNLDLCHPSPNVDPSPNWSLHPSPNVNPSPNWSLHHPTSTYATHHITLTHHLTEVYITQPRSTPPIT